MAKCSAEFESIRISLFEIVMGHILAKNNDPSQRMNIVDICRMLRDDQMKNIVVMCGPGINTPPEMDDFEYNGEGFYGLVEPEYDIENVEDLLSTVSFDEDPRAFFIVLKDIFDHRVKNADVTFVHKFLKVLDDLGVLRRVYTSNVDSGERRAGLSASRVIEAYGTLRTSHCTKCNKKYDFRWLSKFMKRGNFDTDEGDVSVAKCKKCDHVVRPDVVLIGDRLSDGFYRRREADMAKCDLLIMLGTRLTMAPFCELAKMTGPGVPRLYVNNIEPAYNVAVDELNLHRRNIMKRSTDVVVTKYRIDYTVGDICAILKWTKRVRAVKEKDVKHLD